MKNFEILQELSKGNTETQSEQVYWKDGVNGLVQPGLSQTFNL